MNEYKALIKRILDFRNARDWKKFHTEENLAKSISIEAGELLEHFQWGDSINKDEVSNELADILIYSFLLSEKLNVDPIEIMNKKISENEERFLIQNVKGNSGKKTRTDKL
ncbi:nucleotide pyrophosphohydrolase [Spirochaeta cellobiosiphila]|uniref:nucleotide pyrophosphohydrolase n=1 Tax=Spirochaeta cellobiosiphila TaxID=504483 RepID=UPI000400C7EF|nr:nucleotide pyrophosphohydrolase [Spirochaeta cellobiosiphila]